MGEKVRGYLLLIGGAEDKKGDMVILKRFIELCKQRDSYTVIFTAATSEPETTGKQYQTLFNNLGQEKIRILNIANRIEAHSREKAEIIAGAGSIFFTGGDQLRITSLLGGTAVNQALHQAYEEGAIIAGTSAGASVVSDLMIIAGNNDQTPQMQSVRLAPGLGLLEEVVIDQHFAQRGRIGRLLMTIACNPFVIGIGLDEDTAIEVNHKAELTVRGSQTVTILDGSGITHSNVYELGEQQPLALLDVRLHTLSAGYTYDLQTRQVKLNK